MSADPSDPLPSYASAPAALSGNQLNEISFITGVDASGLANVANFWSWTDGTIPAVYASADSAHKWQGGAAGTPGGTLSYYFDPGSNWTGAEQQGWVSALSLWSAVANINFVQTSVAGSANVTFLRNYSSQAYEQGGFTTVPIGSRGLGSNSPTGTIVTIDTSAFGDVNDFSRFGGYGVGTVVHELGHLIGLGHGGPYNGIVNPATQQFSANDTRLWTIMSYIQPTTTSARFYNQYTVTGTYWGSAQQSFTWMPLDILAAQQLYGMPTSTPLSGGQVFGFNCNISGPLNEYFNFQVDTRPVVTLWDMGGNNTLDLSGFASASVVNLNPGAYSSCNGLANNIAIAFNTQIDRAVGGAGNDRFIVNTDGDTIDGGGGTNTVVFAGPSTQYSFGYSAGVVSVTDSIAGRNGANALRNIRYLQFTDRQIDTNTLLIQPIGIGGTVGGQTTTDATVVAPFSHVVINDPNPGQIDTLTVTLSSAANGTLINLGGGNYNAATGVYSASGTAAVVTAELNNLIFVPTSHQVTPGQSVATRFGISVSDTAGQSASDSATTVTAAATTPGPSIAGTRANQGVVNLSASQPFAGVTIADPNPGAVDTLAVTMVALASGAFSGFSAGSYSAGNGIYTVSGTADAITSALNSLQFTQTQAPGVFVTTSILALSINGSTGTSGDASTSVTSVTQLLGFASLPSSQIALAISPNDPVAPTPVSGKVNELVISSPVAGSRFLFPLGYRAEYLGGTADVGLVDTSVGNALLVANQGNDVIDIGAANDTVVGSSGATTVHASVATQVFGQTGNLVFGALAGRSTVVAGAGASTIGGGSFGVVVGAGTGTANVSGLATIFGAANGTVVYSGSGGALFVGGAGTETFDASGAFTGSMIWGSGSSQATDVIRTGFGADTISAQAAVVSVTGGSGGTFIGGGSNSLSFVGGSGTATIVGSVGTSSLTAGAGGVVFGQHQGSATVSGLATLYGSANGQINYVGNSGRAIFVGEGGAGSLNASGSSTGNTFWLSMDPNSSATVAGGSGIDSMVGGAGASTVSSGVGPDLFVFLNGHGGGTELITDFSANSDYVVISGYGAGAATTALQNAVSSGGSTTVTLADNTRITFQGIGSADVLKPNFA